MVQFNHAGRELTIKIVFYGPALSGKTTNLQKIYERIDSTIRGRLLTVDTADDRTLFFDMLPVFFQSRSGLKVKVKLFTVPGQAIHNATRRVVLQGADGIIFVADGRRSAALDNNGYWKNMLENLKDNSLHREDVPIVVQFNKLDLPDVKTPHEIEEFRRKGKELVFGAVAIRGDGVIETLHGLLQIVYRHLDGRFGLAQKFQLPEREFLANVFKNIDLKGTRLESTYQGGAHG